MQATFDAHVLSCEPAGDRFVVALDRTAFYPTSGGQPHDTGQLRVITEAAPAEGAHVLDVVDAEAADEFIRHVVDRPLPEGARVRGEIDWPRRFDHMQQHTGQHVLSAAFDRLFGVRTVSFHLGADSSTIDLAREVSAGEIERAEAAANQVVWDDRPVTIRFATDDEAAALPLRKEPARTGRLRLIEVAEFDLSACGGTHVPSAGRIGAILVAGWERFKGGSRVGFVCGGRAVRAFGALRDLSARATRPLSIGIAELPAAVERLQSEQKAQARLIRKLQEEVAATRGAALRASAEARGGLRWVVVAQPGWDGAALRTLAAAVVAGPGVVTVLAGDGHPAPVVVARSADVAFDAAAWLSRAASVLGGRGGGRPELAQGGLAATADEVLAYARENA
jgi:alanyl-tRNA synthetase